MASNLATDIPTDGTTPAESPGPAEREQFLGESNPHRTCLNHFCFALSCFTSLVALSLGVLEVLGFFFLTMTILENILCCYIILFCFLVIVTETNLFGLAGQSKFLNSWALRGLFYAFIGVLGLNAINTNVIMQGEQFSRDLFRDLVVAISALLMGIGLLYLVLGLLCVQVLYDKMENKYQERKARAKKLKGRGDKYGALSESAPATPNIV
jgi:hypothetical protein